MTGARLRLARPSQIGVVIVAMHQRWKLAMFRLERSYSGARNWRTALIEQPHAGDENDRRHDNNDLTE
jgi:hypothetical protein